MEYKDTIFLPKTSFEMRANLPLKEPRILKEWDNIDHQHKDKLSKELLQAGTGYRMRYTNLIMDAANHWLKMWEKENG